MATTTNNCKNISIVEGNDTVLKLWLYTRELQNNATVRVPFNFDDGDKVEVRLCSRFKTENLQAERDGTEDNCLIVLLPWTVAAKCYGLEVKVERDGKHLRSFDCGRISIVGCNSEASPTLERVNTLWQAGMEVDMQIAFSAVVHGENAYEIWRRQPGNENKTLQDFIDEVLNLNKNAAAARQASRDANAAAMLASEKAQAAEMAAANAKADYVGEDNYVRHWNPITQQYDKTNIYVKGDRGENFTYNDFTPEQITELQRPATEKAEEVEAAEKLRKQAESARSNAEEARQGNETIRENNEQTRQSNTSTAISNAEAATSSANNAASNAEEKAVLANTKAQLADQKAVLADTAAQNANTKAALADQKATLADTAAQNANAAAEKIQTASFAVDAEMNLILLKNEQSTLALEVTDGVLYEIKEQ